MTRIVAGSAGGRRIAVPPGHGTRPTSDRVREALFNTLHTLTDLDGARVLDLYAGSGALGLEALSRGAAHALLVELDPRAARTIRDNARALGLSATVAVDRVERVLADAPETPYDVVLADPPYALSPADLDAVLAALTTGWLAPGAVVVVERGRGSPEPVWPAPLNPLRRRRYGDVVLWYGHTP